MEINVSRGITPSVLKPEEAKKLNNTQSVTDEVLDLSDSSRLAEELASQPLDKVTAVKIGDRFVSMTPGELEGLVKNLRQQLLDGKELKSGFNAVRFSEKTGISLQFTDFTRKSAMDYMVKRAEARLQVQDIGELRRALKEDLNLVEKSYKKGDVPAKVLLQDMALLERKGLLTPDEKVLYQQVMDRMIGQFDKGKGFELSKADMQALKAILHRVADDTSPAEVLNVDRPAISRLGAPEAGSPAEQYQVVADNTDAVLAASDAAMHDLSASSREVGTSVYRQQQKIAKGEKVDNVELGRTKGRVMQAVKEADRQYTLIRDKMLPAIRNQVTDLEKRMDARVLELVVKACPSLAGETDAAKIKAYLDGHPEVKSEIDADPQLNGLRLERDQAVSQYKTLTTRMSLLGESKVEGLKKIQTLDKLAKEEKTRVGVMKNMTGTLDTGVARLKQLEQELFGLQNSSHSDEDLQAVQDRIEEIKNEVQTLSVALADQMDDLIKVCKAQKSTDPKVLAVLETQRDTLRALTYDIPFESFEDIDKCVMGLKDTITMLEGIRKTTLDTIKGSNNVSAEEKDALGALDNKVTTYTGAKVSIDGQILDSEAMIKAKIQMAEDETKDDSEKAFGFIEDLDGAEPQGTEGEHGTEGAHGAHHVPRFGLAYGSHVSAKVDIFIGGSIGVSGLAQAKVKAFIGAGVKIEKSFGQGPSYGVTVDVHAKIKGEATVLWVFHGSKSIEKKLQAGLAFDDLGQVNDFRKQLATVIALALDGEVRSDRFKRELAKLEDMIDAHSFTGSATEEEQKAKIGLDSKHAPSAEYVDQDSTETNDYGSVRQGNQKKVTDTKHVNQIQVSDGHHHYAIKVTRQQSDMIEENGKPVHKPPYTRTSLQIALPPSVVRDAVKYGISKIPPGLLDKLFDSFKAANPDIAMNIDAFKASLNTTLAALRSKFGPAVERVVQLAEKLHVEATFALEYVNEPGVARYVAVEVGIEKKWDTGEVTLGKIGSPVLSGEIGFQAQAEVEAGIYAKVMDLEPEKAEH